MPRLCLFRHYDHDVLYYTHDEGQLRLMGPYSLVLPRQIIVINVTYQTYVRLCHQVWPEKIYLLIVWWLELSSLMVEHVIVCKCLGLLITKMENNAVSLSGLLSICSAGYLSTVSPQMGLAMVSSDECKGYTP